MKKKLICGILIGTLVFSSAILTGCGSSNEVSQNTTNPKQTTSTETNSDNSSADANDTSNSSSTSSSLKNSTANTSDNDETIPKEPSNDTNKKESSIPPKTEIENPKNINKDNADNNDSSKTTSNSTDSKNPSSKDSSNTDDSQNTSDANKNNISADSTKDDSTPKDTTKLTMQQLADKIADFEYDGNVKYITPVNPIGSGKDLTYKEDPSSNIFFCSDDKFDSNNLKYGTLVNLFGYNKENDSYSFRVTNYESLKNGGTGTIDYGTVTSQGKINSANAN